jgi:hypothetical protein
MMGLIAFAAIHLSSVVVIHQKDWPKDQKTYVALFYGSSAVAVSKYHFLTAKHVKNNNPISPCSPSVPFFNSAKMNGVQYCISRRFDHPTADLSIVEIDRAQYPLGLPGFHRVLSPSFPKAKDDHAYLGGFGYTAGPEQPNGYPWAPRMEKWGENLIHSASSIFLSVSFTSPTNALPFEATATTYDSGGGLFLKDKCGNLGLAAHWVSASCTNQFTSYGCSAYAIREDSNFEWIKSVLGNEMLTEGHITGDVNDDGSVDLADFNILSGNFGKDGARSGGDLNGDGKVNVMDFGVLATHFGREVCE